MLKRWTERLYEIRQCLSVEIPHPKTKIVSFLPTMAIVKPLYKIDIYCRILLIIILPYILQFPFSEDSPFGVPFLPVDGKQFDPIGGSMAE
jgi:hypothetical protein